MIINKLMTSMQLLFFCFVLSLNSSASELKFSSSVSPDILWINGPKVLVESQPGNFEFKSFDGLKTILWFYHDENQIPQTGATINKQTLEWNSRGTYTVGANVSWVGANSSVSITSSDEIQVRVVKDRGTLFVPEAFADHSDNDVNREFKPVGLDIVITQFNIRDKSGNDIFDCKKTNCRAVPIYEDPSHILFAEGIDIEYFKGWDGTYNGAEVPDGEYDYTILYHSYNHPEKINVKSGTVTKGKKKK